jgi:hypothetical protein
MRWMQYIVVLMVLAGVALGRNVDLSTVPERKTVQLTIYNSEDLTLVRETRVVTFKKGNNPLQFSWANTLIDSSSVELKFLTQADKLEVLDTTFPHDKPQMLYWNVKSDFDGAATIQITYFTSGITWSADYTLITDPEEKTAGLEGFIRVYNHSGEEYEDAQVRLVVGKVNLVEKIARLAQITYADAERGLKDGKLREWKKDAMEKMVEASDSLMNTAGPTGSTSPVAMKPKEVIKEGLSEYFIFTIEGAETIKNGWSKQMRASEAASVPFTIQYRYRPSEYGDQLVRMYLLTNDVPSKLGTSPLPDGVYRVFRQNGRGGLSYLTQQSLKYIPVGDKIELNLGADPEVVFELIKQKSYRDNIWMRWNGGRITQRVDDGAVKVAVNATVVGWIDHTVYAQRIRNYTSKAINVEVRRTYSGDVAFKGTLPGLKLFDFQTPDFTVDVAAGTKQDFGFEVLTRQGTLSKQNRVELTKE